MRDRLFLLLKLTVAAAAIYWLVSSGRLNLTGLSAVGQRWHWLALAQIPFLGILFMASIRWQNLLRAQGIDYPYRDTLALTLTGWFFNQMVMGTTGGDVYKAYAVAKKSPDQRSGAVMSIFVDRAIGMIVLMIVVLTGAFVNRDLIFSRAELSSFVFLIGGIFGSVVVGGALFYSNRIRNSAAVSTIRARLPFQDLISKLDQAMFTYRYHPREVAIALATSAALHMCTISVNLCLANALLPEPFEWRAFFVLIPLAHTAMAVPINPPGAIGTAEAIYAHLFGLVGIQVGSLLCILQRLVFYLWAIPGALLYVTRKPAGSAADDAPMVGTESTP